MALSAAQKAEIIKTNQHATDDTGSPEVQIALLTADIEKLAVHFDKAKKDHHGRRGLLTKVSKRRKLLNYLKNIDSDRYQNLLEKLNIRR